MWQADGVAIPPDGGTVPSGYGEWTGGVTGTKWSPNWSTITWRAVDCDLMAADFSTGNAPWDWNASPGNGTLRLNDPDHVYFPGGPGSGWFDDIGVNTPIRVVAHLTAAYDQNPANAAKRLPDRVLATGLIRSITHDLTPAGTASTTINFSEPHVLYGRVNREAIHLAQAPHENYRFEQIQGLSDDPETGLLDYPRLDDSYAGDVLYGSTILMQATDVGSDLWTEMCKTGQSGAYVMGLRLYENAKSSGNPRVHAFISVYPKEIGSGPSERSYGLDTRVLTTECSPPSATFNYTNAQNTSRAVLSLCPVGSITFGHDDSDLANAVSISAANGNAEEVDDQASIDRFYRHTYQRHDLLMDNSAGVDYTPEIAARYLDRMVRALYHISDCDFVIEHPRDFEFTLGAPMVNSSKTDHPPLEPSRWIKLDWGWLLADLRVTQISHSITPTGWTVTHSYEVHNPDSKDSR